MGGPVTFSPFDGRCFGQLDKEVPLPPISKEDVTRFSEVPISDKSSMISLNHGKVH